MDLDLRKAIEDERDYMVSLRRELHRFPEVSSDEFHTREILLRELEALGAEVEKIDGTGLIVRIEGKEPGPCRVIRADMDGLPVAEEDNLRGKKVCVSENPGKCHACGHDAHMAMLMGALRVLLEYREHMKGTVLCCFEEGEEYNTGVDKMLSALSKYPVEACFSLHVYAELDSGRIDISPGPRMSGMVGIGFHVIGRPGHGSRPDQAVNPIVPAAHIITQLDSAFNGQLSAEEPVTLGLCVFEAGEAPNVIPESAYIAGTARYFSPAEGDKALEIVKRIAVNTADSYRCRVDFAERNRIILPPVINDAGIAGRVKRGVSELYGDGAIGTCPPWFASESFSLYLEKYPGAVGFLGIRNEACGSGAPHHNGRFDIDEDVLPLGAAAHLAFVFGE